MKVLDLFSGISAPSVAWHPLGWETLGFSEIDKFPSAVLSHHYPETPNLGVITKHKEWKDYEPDVVVGGSPCQAFSVAGLRKGLDDERGNLTLTYLAVVSQYRPRWVVWENVPGVLSIDKGRTFGAFLGGLAELGYGFAYRVLDAQHFGVPQRRRRVFVVGYLGDWRKPAAVLFERESLRRHPAPRREAGENAPTLPARSTAQRSTDFDFGGGLIARCDTTGEGSRLDGESCNFVTHSFRGEGFDASEDGTGRGTPLVFHPTQDPISNDICHSLGANATAAVAFAQNQRDEVRQMAVAGALAANPGVKQQTYVAATIAGTMKSCRESGGWTNSADHAAAGYMQPYGQQIRRLTPRECERLQGFPDDYTDVPYRNRRAADGPRYKALGNSMAVPVVRWIGERITAVEAIMAAEAP